MNQDTNEVLVMLQTWDGTELHAKKVWAALQQHIVHSAHLVLELTNMAVNESGRFHSLLLFNRCTYLKSQEENTSPLEPDECVAALFLSIFDWLCNPVYNILEQCRPESPSKPQSQAERNFGKLCWVFHCLLVHFPHKYTELRSHFAIASQHGNNQLNLLDLIRTVPGSLKDCDQLLPFITGKTLLTCFGCNRNGLFLIADCEQGVVKAEFPQMLQILQSINGCEQVLAEKQCAAIILGSIDDYDAAEIAHSTFGIPQSYWAIHSANLCGLPTFQEHWRRIQKVWEEHRETSCEVANKAVRDFYALTFVNDKKEDARLARLAKKGQSDPMQSQMLDHQVTEEDKETAKRSWLSRHNMREAGKSNKKGRNGGSDARAFKADIRMSAMKSAAFICAKSWNHGGEPLDFKLKAGMTLRSKFKLSGKPCKDTRLLAKAMSLGEGGAPTVMFIQNAFSDSFLEMDRKITNQTRFCKDDRSDGGSSSIAAFYHCDGCEKGKMGGDCEGVFLGPLMKVGLSNSVVSRKASNWEKLKMDMATELANSIIDLTNQILFEIRTQKNANDCSGEKEPKTPVDPTDLSDYNRKKRAKTVVKQLLSGNIDKVTSEEEAVIDSDFGYFPQQRVNCNICKVGPKTKYGIHQDSSWILNSTLTKPKFVKNNGGAALPTQTEMVVVTMVTGTGPCEARVSWHRQNTELLHVVTNDNCVHIQLAGVQDNGVFHQSDFVHKREAILAKANAPHGKQHSSRKIDTYRMTACPACDTSVYQEGIVDDGLHHARRKETPPWCDYQC